ncbi:hypothetical protein T09_2704 [Trichinella sp. T9]|nr:hypothetical protein T09_2704 [Trichinella sp. T9]
MIDRPFQQRDEQKELDWISNKKKLNWLQNLSGAWIEHLKLFLNGTSSCSPFILTVRKHIATYCEFLDNLIAKAAALRVVLQPRTIICYFETALIPAKVADLGLRTRYLHEVETKKKIKMFVATAFLLLPEVLDVMDLLGTDVTGLLAALFDYFRRKWMTPNKLPFWNVYNVQTCTSNHLEG